MVFHVIGKGRYEIHEEGRKVADIKRHYICRYTKKPMLYPRHGQAWSRGYNVTDLDGKTEHFRNLNAIHRRYKFKNYPGFGHILRTKPFTTKKLA